MEGSVPNRERDAVQQRLCLLPQRRLLFHVVVHVVLPGIAAAAAISAQQGPRQRAAVRVCHFSAESSVFRWRSKLLGRQPIPGACIVGIDGGECFFGSICNCLWSFGGVLSFLVTFG